jgi:ribonuclease HI
VQLWTDGACAGNPGPGGWAALLLMGAHERMVSGGEEHTTNNRMELLAPIRGLEALTRPCVVDLHIDSTYVMFGFTKRWIAGWRRRAVDGVWLTASKQPVVNQDLWEALEAAVGRHTVRWHQVKGHAGIELNERVDVEAVAQRDRFSRRVYTRA